MYGSTTELFEGRAAYHQSARGSSSEGGSEGKQRQDAEKKPRCLCQWCQTRGYPPSLFHILCRCVSRRPSGPIVPPKGCKTDQSAVIHADALTACPPCVDSDPGLRPPRGCCTTGSVRYGLENTQYKSGRRQRTLGPRQDLGKAAAEVRGSSSARTGADSGWQQDGDTSSQPGQVRAGVAVGAA